MRSKSFKALIVDDEKELRDLLSQLMHEISLEVFTASDGEMALRSVLSESPDVVLLDLKMPGMGGKMVLDAIKSIDPDLPVVIITGYADISGAVEMTKAGVYDYLGKPFDHSDLIRIVKSAIATRNFKKSGRNLSCNCGEPLSLRKLMGASKVVGRLISDVNKVAKSNFTTIITGETGSGKELVSQAIHQASSLRAGPFYAIDCGAITPTLLESELFGHEKGAFTDAVSQKKGKLEEAEGGTILLDEITNMPLDAQAKLLRVLQEKVLYRVGGTTPVKLDVRLLVASNIDLKVAIDAGTFRDDLYYRLNEFVIKIPPLRKRKEDIPQLANRFLTQASLELNKDVREISSSAMDILLAYDWPGNVRQLRSTMRRAVLLANEEITEKELNQLELQPSTTSSGTPVGQEIVWDGSRSFKEIVKQSTRNVERNILSQVLILTGGNKAKAARMLKIDYKTIHSKVKSLGITKQGAEQW